MFNDSPFRKGGTNLGCFPGGGGGGGGSLLNRIVTRPHARGDRQFIESAFLQINSLGLGYK